MQSNDNSLLVQQLTTLLSRYPLIKLAILFGSQADPACKKHFGSDIDLAIMTTEPISSHFKMELIQAISTKLDRPVDIVIVMMCPNLYREKHSKASAC